MAACWPDWAAKVIRPACACRTSIILQSRQPPGIGWVSALGGRWQITLGTWVASSSSSRAQSVFGPELLLMETAWPEGSEADVPGRIVDLREADAIASEDVADVEPARAPSVAAIVTDPSEAQHASPRRDSRRISPVPGAGSADHGRV